MSKLKHWESEKKEHEVEDKGGEGSEDVRRIFLIEKRNQSMSMRPMADTSCI
jgi:hypothetical protein